MKASELRIGNLLQGRTVVKVSSIHSDDIVKIEGNTSIFGVGKNPCLEPIPLTEEILLKCGFVFDKELELFHKGKWAISINKETGECLFFIVEVYDLFVELFEFKYLHQLQNIFALTGEELEVKL